MTTDKLKFQFGNAKLMNRIAVLNLPAGYSCPGALKCLSRFDSKLNKVVDGPNIDFRCFGAMEERYPNVRTIRWHNFNLIKSCKDLDSMVNLISNSLPNTDYIRPHASAGDFFNETYFLAWLNVAINNPKTIFYTYTKMPQFLVKYKKQLPKNFRIIASFGGKQDILITQKKLKFAKVFLYENDAINAGLEIDHDDSHAFDHKKQSFGLLLHGMQPADTEASKVVFQRMQSNQGYNQKNKFVPKMTTSETIHIR